MIFQKVRLLIIFILVVIENIFGQNPIVPAGVYFADPSARVWSDGKLYVYGSKDESPNYYCSYNYDVLSTNDLMKWTNTSNVFTSKGNGDQVNYSDGFLYAPDCQYKNGKYYLYYCMSDKRAAEGVATSTSPTGPFKNGVKMKNAGVEEIDPAVFIDDDGQAYYIWGQFSAKIAKLKPDMQSIDSTSIVKNLLTEKEHHFHEGSFMTKRNGIYYMVYADMSRANRPTCLGYATSKSPLGPFTYRGVIIDNDNCDPANWNNHGSIVEYKGQWYVFYHRTTNGSVSMRKACVEPIYFNADGTIDEVEMTTQGAAPPLSPFDKIEAERACLLNGSVRVELFESGNEKLTSIKNSDNVAYKYFDFKEGANAVDMRIKVNKEGTVIVRLDQPWGPIVGISSIKGKEGDNWQDINFKIKEVKGVHAVWLGFYGNNESTFELDWFIFKKGRAIEK